MAIIVLNGRTGLKGQEANFCPNFLHPCEEYMHLQWTLWLGVQKVGPWDMPCSYLRRSHYNHHLKFNYDLTIGSNHSCRAPFVWPGHY